MRNPKALMMTWLLLAAALSGLSAGPLSAWQSPGQGEAPAGTPSWDRPMAPDPAVDRWIAFLTGRNAERTRLWLERSGRYAPHIRAQLRARGMPEDLLYLAMIESGFSPKAHSNAAAAGIWQFISETGRRYGLHIDSHVDERRDPIASTEAALDYLQALHRRFGSWYLAAAAYNTGENRVERILRERAGGRRGSDALYWRIAPWLPQETRDYVPLMLAAGQVARAPESYGFTGLRYHPPLAFDSVYVSGATSLESVARERGTTLAELQELNPHLRRSTTPPEKSWIVRVPRASSGSLATRSADVASIAQGMPRLAGVAAESPVARKSVASSRYHRVRRGESLWSLARHYGMTVTRLQSLNGMGRRSRIYAGQTLRVS